MDEIIEKVADLVSTLVIAVRDSEEKNTRFGDMVPAAEMIRKSADGMVEAAGLAMDDIHEEFKQNLQSTADDLRIASEGLVVCAQQARIDPMNRTPQKAAIKHAKQVLEKVVHLVLIEDQSNIKSLVMVGKRTGEECVKLVDISNPQQLQILLPDIKSLEDNFVDRAEIRAQGSKNADFVHRIQAACGTIRAAAPNHFRAVAKLLTSPQSPELRKETQTECNTILNAIDEVIVVVREMFARNAQFVEAAFKWKPIRTIAEDQVQQSTNELHDKLTTLPKYIAAGQGAQEARAVVGIANRAIEAAHSVAANTSDPTHREIITQAADHLQKLQPQVIAAIKPVMEDPDNAEAVRQLDELIRNAQLATSTLAAAVALTPAQTVATNATQVLGVLDALSEAIKKGDAKAIKTGVGNVVDALNRHIDIATTWANSLTDPEQRAEALAKIQRLKELRDRIADVGRRLAENPNDAKLAAELEALIAEAKAITSSMISPSEVVAALSNQIANNLDLLRDAVKRGDKYLAYEGLQIAKNIAADLKRQMEAAEAFAATITDPVHKQQLMDAIRRVKEISPQLLEAIKYVLEHPNDPAGHARLNNLIEQTKQASAHLASVAQLTPQEELEAKLRAEEVKRKKLAAQAALHQQEQAQLQRVKIEGPVNQAVLLAAKEVEEAVANKIHDNSPLGQLVSQSHLIADEMAKLSMYAAQGNVKEMILAARRIREAVNAVIANAKLIADECTDPRLKADVINYAQAITSFSTQLKIITSVKSAEETMNQATENQLVTCAQGLATAVIRTVRAADSAAIRSANRKPITPRKM